MSYSQTQFGNACLQALLDVKRGAWERDNLKLKILRGQQLNSQVPVKQRIVKTTTGRFIRKQSACSKRHNQVNFSAYNDLITSIIPDINKKTANNLL